MDAGCANWKVKTLSFTTTSFSAVFNNGAGVWDNPGNVSGSNYTVPAGSHQVKNGAIITNAGNPCVLDTAAPSVPTALKSTSVGSHSISLSWTASTDNVGVTAYNVYRNGVLAGSTSSASYNDTNLTPSTAYSYKVSAKDAAGNNSAQSAMLAVNTSAAPASAKPGVTYSASQSTFAIWSPDHLDVKLKLAGVLYPMAKAPDANGYSNVYTVTVPGNHHLKHYSFVLDGKTVRDPYGVMVDASTSSATPDNIVLDLSTTNLSTGWAATPAMVQREDAIIYEVHVRDFTVDASSGVDVAKRGKFAGMTQTGTTLNGAGVVKTGIDHLKELGVTHVQLLPIYDFGTCSPLMVQDPTNPVPDANPYPSPLCYNWGYDPVNFNVPEERYASNQADPVARVRELKTMINEFHKNGIRVIMDVVYNHTYNKAVFGDISSKYYTALDLSGTGNSIDVKNPMVARMIRDSLEYWAREYNLDGFRFDLMGIYDRSVVADWSNYLNQQFPGRNLLIYGEPWNGYATDPAEADRVRLGSVGTIVNAHVGVFNSKYRDALKGDGDSSGNFGFIFNAGDYWGTGQWNGNGAALGPVSSGMVGSPRYYNAGGVLPNTWDPMFALDPEQSINYVDAHDNYCLNDKVDAWASANGQAANTGYKERIQHFALGSILTAQGISFLHGGSEFKRSKGGDKNSYRSPDSINSFKWGLKATNPTIMAMVKKLIAMRKNHPALRLNSWQAVRDNVKSDQQSKSLVLTTINGAAVGDSWKQILIVQNSGGNASINLPAGTWYVALEQSNPNLAERAIAGTVVAEGTALTVLYQK
jgi:pullulanase